MSTNLVNVQLTGEGPNIKNEPNDINKKVPPDVKKEQKQYQPNSFYKKKKNQKINNIQNFNNATPAQIFALHHGPNYFVPPNLAQNLGGPSLYTMPGMHQNMVFMGWDGQNAALKPNPQTLGRKKSTRMLRMRQEIQQLAAVTNLSDKQRIAREMSIVDQMDSEVKKYKKLVTIHTSILRITKPTRRKMKMIQEIQKAAAKANRAEKERIEREMSKIQGMDSSKELQHLAILKQSISINRKSTIFTKTVDSAALKQQKPVITILTAQTNNDNFTQDIVTPAQSLQQQRNQSHVVNPNISDITRRGARNNKKKNTVIQNVQVINVYKPGSSTSQFQAPHQDEPEDLSDDLAPHMGQAQQQPATQTLPLTAENKLNFKFQRTTQTKTPDWSEYQNKFKRIGGASPDQEDEDCQEVKQEPNKDQSINTGYMFEEDVEMKELPTHHINVKQLNVAVTTEPYLYLSDDQVKEIDEALVNKIQDAIFNQQLSYIPTFQDIPVHNLGHLPLNCQGPKDLIWLHETLSSIPSPIPNVNLVIKPQSEIPNMIKVKLFVPNFSGNLEELKYLLQKQNHWYDLSTWMLVKSEKQGDDPSNYTLEYRVPEIQAMIIDNRDRRVAYSLGSIFAIVSDDDTIDTEKVFKYRNAAMHLQVCVLTEPFRYLTVLEVEMIRLALVYKLEKDVYSESGYIPAFRGCPGHFKGGLKIWCESDRDLGWLREAVLSIVSPAIGTKLIIKQQGAVPQRARMTVSIPTTEDGAFILKVLKRQNPWCDVDSWTLFSTWLDAKSKGLTCVFYIPHKHIRLIKEKYCRLSFLLGYVKADIKIE
ncbi:uncharacterized protein LOC134653526 [Cydia amplana]|uniref:uncharacterized protein LOC134653526 n=1 Tax=Cydia amplana TaxID=1869771 RepID=UPI002FE52C52